MSTGGVDPVTDWLRKKFDRPFASRPMGDIDEDGAPIKEIWELADTIRLAVEESGRRARAAVLPRVKEAHELCLKFWRDAGRLGWNFGYPPRTHTVLSRMYDWQLMRVMGKLQKRVNADAQGEMRDTLEAAWASLMFPGESNLASAHKVGHNILYTGRS